MIVKTTGWKILLGCLVGATLAGCANPKVVAQREIGDKDLTCSQIRREMEEVRDIKRDAESDKGFSGKNVAAALFFWPAIIGNEMNTGNAIEAANSRLGHLASLHEKKNCDS